MSGVPVTATNDEPTEGDIQALLARARIGDPDSLPTVRAVLDENPEVCRTYGDLGGHARRSWVELIAGPDLIVRESLGRHLATMTTELAGPAPSPLESLLVDRIVCCWLQLHYADAAAAQASSPSIRQAEFMLKRQDSANRRYLMAIASLALVRRLLARAAEKAGQPSKGALPANKAGKVGGVGRMDFGSDAKDANRIDDKLAKDDLVLEFVPPNKAAAGGRKPGRPGKPKASAIR